MTAEPSADEKRRAAILRWLEGQALRDFIRRKRAERGKDQSNG
jgi:hypothetical protein